MGWKSVDKMKHSPKVSNSFSQLFQYYVTFSVHGPSFEQIHQVPYCKPTLPLTAVYVLIKCKFTKHSNYYLSRTYSCYFIKWLVLLASCEDLQAVISVNAVFLTHLYPHRICVRSTISCWCCDWLCVAFVWSGLRLFYPLWWRRDGVTCWQWRKSLPLLLEKKIVI